MNFWSVEFFCLTAAMLAGYFIVPLNVRWIVLLVFSICFYAVSSGILALAAAVLITFFVWLMAKKVAAERGDRKKMRSALTAAVAFLTAVLVLFKTNLHRAAGISFFTVPLGISYFTFSLIGYIADIYWKKSEPEDNFFRLLLCTLYYPKIVEGPISKFRILGPKLMEGHPLDKEQFWFGLQRIMGGFFKKLVIADRILILRTAVFGDFQNYSAGGAVLLFTTFFSVFQVYCDFSGYMDIVIGLSQMMGIELEENFCQPFLSESAAEFWRRWHITLGEWMKDYIYMPLMISPWLIRLSGKVRGMAGKRAGKAMMTIVPLLAVWLLTGLWHATGLNYVVWGLYWGGLIIFSNVFSPEIRILTQKLHIPVKSKIWSAVRIIRTFLLFTVGLLISTFAGLGGIGQYLFQLMNLKLSNLNESVFFEFGMGKGSMNLMVLSVFLLIAVELLQAHGVRIRKTIAGWPYLARWTIYSLEFLAIILFGIYGTEYTINGFAYAAF